MVFTPEQVGEMADQVFDATEQLRKVANLPEEQAEKIHEETVKPAVVNVTETLFPNQGGGDSGRNVETTSNDAGSETNGGESAPVLENTEETEGSGTGTGTGTTTPPEVSPGDDGQGSVENTGDSPDIMSQAVDFANNLTPEQMQTLIAGFTGNQEFMSYVSDKGLDWISANMGTAFDGLKDLFGEGLTKEQVKTLITKGLQLMAGEDDVDVTTLAASLGVGFTDKVLKDKLMNWVTTTPEVYNFLLACGADIISNPANSNVRESFIPMMQGDPMYLGMMDGMIATMSSEQTEEMMQGFLQAEVGSPEENAITTLMANQDIMNALMGDEAFMETFGTIVDGNQDLQKFVMQKMIKTGAVSTFFKPQNMGNPTDLLTAGIDIMAGGGPSFDTLKTLYPNLADYQRVLGEIFTTLSSDPSFIPGVMGKLKEDNLTMMTTKMLGDSMTDTRQQVMGLAIQDTNLMNILANSTVVANTALGVLPEGDRQGYDLEANPAGLSPLQLTTVAREQTDISTSFQNLQIEVLKDIDANKISTLYGQAMRVPQVEQFFDTTANDILDANKGIDDTIEDAMKGLGFSNQFAILKEIEGEFFSAVRKGALHKTGIQKLDYIAMMKETISDPDKLDAIQEILNDFEKKPEAQGKDFFTYMIDIVEEKHKIKSQLLTKTHEVMMSTTGDNLIVKQTMFGLLPQVLDSADYAVFDKYISSMSNEDISNLLSGILQADTDGNTMASLMPELLSDPATMTPLMAMMTDSTVGNNAMAILWQNNNLKAEIARQLLGSPDAIGGIAETITPMINGMLGEDETPVDMTQIITMLGSGDLNSLTNVIPGAEQFLGGQMNGVPAQLLTNQGMPSMPEVGALATNPLATVMQTLLGQLKINPAKMRGTLTPTEQSAMISAVMADGLDAQRQALMKGVVRNQNVMQTIAGMPINMNSLQIPTASA